MARKTGRGADRPTGPNSKLQGKPLGVHYSKAVEGNENGNGSWSGGGKVVKGMHRGPQRGSRKSF